MRSFNVQGKSAARIYEKRNAQLAGISMDQVDKEKKKELMLMRVRIFCALAAIIFLVIGISNKSHPFFLTIGIALNCLNLLLWYYHNKKKKAKEKK